LQHLASNTSSPYVQSRRYYHREHLKGLTLGSLSRAMLKLKASPIVVTARVLFIHTHFNDNMVCGGVLHHLVNGTVSKVGRWKIGQIRLADTDLTEDVATHGVLGIKGDKNNAGRVHGKIVERPGRRLTKHVQPNETRSYSQHLVSVGQCFVGLCEL
jgi:hypothetical protein